MKAYLGQVHVEDGSTILLSSIGVGLAMLPLELLEFCPARLRLDVNDPKDGEGGSHDQSQKLFVHCSRFMITLYLSIQSDVKGHRADRSGNKLARTPSRKDNRI